MYDCKQTFHKQVGCIISFKEHKFQFSFNTLSHIKGKSFHYPSYLFFAVLCIAVSLVSNSKDYAREIWFRFFLGLKTNTRLSGTGKCQKLIKMLVYSVLYSRFQIQNRYNNINSQLDENNKFY